MSLGSFSCTASVAFIIAFRRDLNHLPMRNIHHFLGLFCTGDFSGLYEKPFLRISILKQVLIAGIGHSLHPFDEWKASLNFASLNFNCVRCTSCWWTLLLLAKGGNNILLHTPVRLVDIDFCISGWTLPNAAAIIVTLPRLPSKLAPIILRACRLSYLIQLVMAKALNQFVLE